MGRETLLSPQAGSSLWAPFCSVCGGDCFPGVTGLCNPLDSQSSPVLQSVCLCLSPSPRAPPTGFASLQSHSLLRSRPSSFPQLRVQGRLGPCSSQDLLLAGLYGPKLGTEAVLSSLWGRDGGSVLGGRLLALCWRRDESRLQGCRQRLAEQTEFFFATRGGSTELKIKRKDQYLSV